MDKQILMRGKMRQRSGKIFLCTEKLWSLGHSSWRRKVLK